MAFLDHSRSLKLTPLTVGATATNDVFVGTNFWTIVFPNGVETPLSGVPYQIQVNNANSLDPTKRGYYVNPLALAWEVNKDVDQFASASADDFESNWISLGDLTSSGYIGTGAFRFVRIVNAGGFTGSAANFVGYVWTQNITNA